MSYNFSKMLPVSFDEAVRRTTEALKRNIELMTEKQVLGFKSPSRLEQVGDKRCEQSEEHDHQT
jgi:hypothetical protein